MKTFLKKFIPAPILSWYHKALPLLANIIYGHPSEKLIVIGVTGTNGKSTTVNLIAAILEEAGYKVGLTSTVNFKIDKKEWLNDKKMTMLGRFALQKLLKQMVVADCDYAIIETSSEGIKQSRHLGINYDLAIFTNLTPEHLESHGNFDNYKNAKGELFKKLKRDKTKKLGGKKIEKISIVNLDDEHASYFLQFPADRKFGYGVNFISDITGVEEIRAEGISLSKDSAIFKVGDANFNLSLLGRFNVYNALVAVCVGLSQKIETDKIAIGLARVKGVAGRMEFIDEGQDFKVLVDYAPEPESMKQLYQTIDDLKLAQGRIIHLLGSAGGGRDKSRRSVLGELAGSRAQFVVVTNEDPYDEDPQEIIDQVAGGAMKAGKSLDQELFKILDRREAINKVLSLAGAGDLVLITGKGSEQAICLERGRKVKWDDRQVVKEELAKI
ncbi:MAG: UDP-N-acetylmuramoyl-L-alanyl-D-glutamate--2,6-diaminopimelate ligase [bacterium]